MSELRKDYILDRWVIINEHRKKRPQQFKKEHQKIDVTECFFCPGNEETTPPEIGRVEKNGVWQLRWFPNKFAAVVPFGKYALHSKGLFVHAPAYGYHEVIVETPDHSKQLAELPEEQLFEMLKVYGQRITELSKKKDVKYVLVFKNHGPEGGTSLVHSHSQVITVPFVPPQVEEEIVAVRKHKKCPYCDILKKEKKSKRKIIETKSFLAFAPYASRFNYEAWIFPKKHVKSITDIQAVDLKELAKIMKQILVKIQGMDLSFNYFLHYSPAKDNLHFHIEIMPRKSTWAGFELSSGIIINSISPEEAARFYRARK
jgi:UDPglucose--hexose-1-phosphate uridylyltransferase